MSNYHEPDQTEQHKERGSTTMAQCGWCEYASGLHRYQYCIEGKCALMKSYSPDVHWDDKCVFLTASQNEVEAYIHSHEYTIRSQEESIKRHRQYIDTLRGLLTKAPYMPPLPEDRKHDHFNINDLVAVYHDKEHKWYFGEVRNGYRHQDGCVSYRLDGMGPQDGNDKTFPFDDGFWGSGMAVPTVLLRTEYDWFANHPNEYESWCNKAYKKSFNGITLMPAPITKKKEE